LIINNKIRKTHDVLMCDVVGFALYKLTLISSKLQNYFTT